MNRFTRNRSENVGNDNDRNKDEVSVLLTSFESFSDSCNGHVHGNSNQGQNELTTGPVNSTFGCDSNNTSQNFIHLLDANVTINGDGIRKSTAADSGGDSARRRGPGPGRPKRNGQDQDHTNSTRSKVAKISTSTKNCDFAFGGMAREDHGRQIYGIEFNWLLKPGQPVIFATVGSNRVSIYECGPSICRSNLKSEIKTNLPLKILQVYEDSADDEVFYTCAWTTDSFGSPLLAAAGYRGIIRIISPVVGDCVKSFVGHGGAINHLLTHSKDHNLLFSCSQDHTIRLWNIRSSHCIVIFGGVKGHRDGVLHMSIDLPGHCLISGGMDHSLMVWRLDREDVQAAIENSNTWHSSSKSVEGSLEFSRPFPTFIQHYPDYSTRDIHMNYVDCVQWFGQFIFSKASTENKIVCWKAGSAFEKWADVFAKKTKETTKIHEFRVTDCEAWYVRFGFDFRNKRCALGNENGQTFVFEMKGGDPGAITPQVLTHPKCTDTIRQASWSRDGNILICVCDDSSIWRWDLDLKDNMIEP